MIINGFVKAALENALHKQSPEAPEWELQAAEPELFAAVMARTARAIIQKEGTANKAHVLYDSFNGWAKALMDVAGQIEAEYATGAPPALEKKR